MRPLQLLLRFLGVELLARLSQRLPGPAARAVNAVLLVVLNLLPLVAVVRGDAGIGDVFLIYWFENVVVWATGIIRVATAEGTGGPRITSSGTPIGNAAFFALHYGTFTLVHGIFTLLMVSLTGLEGGLLGVAVLSLAVSASHLLNLGIVWFGRDQRLVVSQSSAMWAPYPRMFALHVAIIGGFFFLLGGPSGEGRLNQSAGVAILCGVKLLIDLGALAGAGRSPTKP